MNQYPIELHCHTNHSDGDFEVDELITKALDFGYKGLILTDHNTTSGAEEIIEKNLNQHIVFLKGIEWTTYFGHMLVHDPDYVVDWREAKIDTIDSHISEVKKANGLVGIAHPYSIGSPMCTGCHWEFNVEDWSQVNYIELWNKANPHDMFWSEKAYDLWIDLLKRGHKIAASAGRDWHRDEKKGATPGLTYIQTEGPLTPETMKQALKTGAMYITLSHKIDVQLAKDNHQYSFGDTIEPGHYDLSFSISDPDIKTFADLNSEPELIRVIANETVVYETEDIKKDTTLNLFCPSGYIRIEVYGRHRHKEQVRLLITSPIYVN